jgi:hypothetical protein
MHRLVGMLAVVVCRVKEERTRVSHFDHRMGSPPLTPGYEVPGLELGLVPLASPPLSTPMASWPPLSSSLSDLNTLSNNP